MMKIIKMIYHLICNFRFNYFMTIVLNLRLLPFRQAIRLPIVVYSPCETLIRRSRVSINKDARIRFGMIAIGRNDDRFISSRERVYFQMIDSIINVSGNFRLSPGCTIRMVHGILNLGNNSVMGGGSKILCNKSITIGNGVRIAFGCVCCDTNYHYFSINRKVQNCDGSVIIGDKSWIGNNSTVCKGTILPNFSILAARSLVNKDYSKMGEGAFFAGIPAKCIKHECYRVYNYTIDDKIQKHFYSASEPYSMSEEDFRKSLDYN